MIYVLHHKESGFYHEFSSIIKACKFLNLTPKYLKRAFENNDYKGVKESKLKFKKGFSIEKKEI
tara:strand:+ start:3683 stop:3874 length:192 start_codon:yes stop_codon:yes gene_type:complete